MTVSSDEEGEIFPDSLTDYEFISEKDDHISFAFLPLVWRKDEPVENVNLRMFVSGVSVDGLRKIYKQVLAWRFELSYVQPEVSVLCKGNHWVKLLKPKKLFEGAVRSILITIQCLHFVKHNPEAAENSIWCHLSRVFGTYEVAPSEVDCMNHLSLIRDAAERDKTLKNSEYMLGILLEKPTKGKVLQMDGVPVRRDDFIADEFVDDPCELDDIVDNEEELFDTCCSLCDNGGDILCCEGRCMRSFHATVASGEGLCDSLGLSPAQVKAIPNFICKNCQYEQHQCSICGKLGSSDISSNPEVFPCIAASCGRFYHPRCVSQELNRQNDTHMEDLEKKIAAGESFACPAHKCYVCKLVENREVDDLQFAVCRRCPKSYHRKCLPRDITFEDDNENGILQRAWDGLLPKRILIYCLDHEIDPDLCTPLRDHIVLPGAAKEREPISKQHLTSVNVLPKKRKLISNHAATESVEQKTVKQSGKVQFSFKGSDSTRPVGKSSIQPTPDDQKKAKLSNQILARRGRPVKIVSKPDVLSRLHASKIAPEKSNYNSEKVLKSNVMQPSNADKSGRKVSAVHSAKHLIKKQSCSSPVTDIKLERRITDLMERVNSSFDVEEFKKQQMVPSIYSQNTTDKNLTKVKVENAVKAVRAALEKLNNGGTIDDAKSVCSAEMLRQISLWKKKLDVYLAPFLHGMSYTSYGRHFTKREKLEEIVERLHWYVKDGDTIVDFCCGANDFSWLMKKKLDSVGKKCNFKNYDLFPSKNDFSFEQRDWFTVNPRELPEGSRLIMGLNPPFGYKAALANQFISKALQFQPKLLILIVPPETRRLDSRADRKRYDLIWEDPHLLFGESFYLPGSCDSDAKQLSQWNKITPPLYLWSRPDWTLKHKEIAHRCGQFQLCGQQPSSQPPTWNYLLEEQQDCYGDFSSLMNEYGNLPAILDDVPEHNDISGLREHNFDGNFTLDNVSVTGNSTNIPGSGNAGIVTAASQLETDICVPLVDDLEDMDISPSNSPSCYISSLQQFSFCKEAV